MANRILLADDSITIQKVVNLTFADEGIEVVAVSNGDQAERRLADVQPDLVLADIFMPGKNGYELCEAIKESAQFHHIPVVLLVGAFEPFDQAEARRVKADAHLTKPFESRTLVDTVRKLISASGQPRSGPLPPLPVPDAKAAPVEPAAVAPPAPPPPVEAPAAMPMTQPFNLDLPMANPPAPPAPPPMMTATMPLNYNYGSNEDPLAVPIEVQVGDTPAADTAFAASSNLHRKTDDLSFVDSQPPFETLGLEDLFAEPPASEATPHLATGEAALPGLTGSNQETGFGVPSAFGYAAEEMLLDLDQPTPTMTRPAHEPFAFDLEEQEAASIDLAAEPAVLKTTILESPAPPVDAPVNTNPLEMPAAQATDETGGTAFAAEPMAEESALFNVDDPLGDVLDEGTLEVGTSAATEAASAPLGNAAESLEVAEPPVAAPVEAPHLEAIAADASTPAEAPASRAELPADYEVEFPAEPVAEAAPIPAHGAAGFEMNLPPLEPSPGHETGFGFTPAVEEIDAESALHSGEAKFTTSSMWTNEEARFAAIDIEATPVEAPAEDATASATVEAAEPPALAPDTSAYVTQPDRPAEVAAPVAEAAPPAEAAQAPAATGEMSPALIDEIVRRVVAQISESVIREIAWEVVPDCVERIVKEMTAQGISKH